MNDIDTITGYFGYFWSPPVRVKSLVARYYEPATAQFVTQDPMLNQTDQAYVYSGGNPVNASDPSGMWPWGGLCIHWINCGGGSQSIVGSWLWSNPKPICSKSTSRSITTTTVPNTTTTISPIIIPGPHNYPDGSNAQSAWVYLTDNLPGLYGFQVAGIIGNLMVESYGVNPTQGQVGGGGGYGIAQWGGSRLQGLIALSDYNSLNTQLGYLVEELNSTYSRALANLKSTSNINTATESFMNYYEQPDANSSHLDWREQDANWALSTYSYLTA